MPSCIRIIEKKGFAQRHFQSIKPSIFLPEYHTTYYRSPVTLNTIRKDVLQYGNTTAVPTDFSFKLATMEAQRAFYRPGIAMIHLNDVFRRSDLRIWSSSPGLPWSQWYSTKRDVADNPVAVQQIRKFAHLVKLGHRIYAPDCCAFVRSHLTDSHPKIRSIWGYPMTMTLCEATFALPLIENFQRSHTPLAYGYETALGGAIRLRRELAPYKHFLALDFTCFDKTVPKQLVDFAFDILGLNLDFINYRDYGVASAINSFRLFEYLREYFINTPIRLCNGERYRKCGGIASGSYFTQLVGSICNYVVVQYAVHRLTGSFCEYIRVFGDDSVCATKTRVDLDDVQAIVKELGMDINVRKSVSTGLISNLTFLGYSINDGYPTKDVESLFASLYLPERPDTCWDDVASRACALYYCDFGAHQRFSDLCRDIVSYRGFRFKLSRPLQRLVDNIGIEVSTTLPDLFDFMRMLKLC